MRKSGLLEFVDSGIDLDDVGGLENLKRWLSRRNGAWLDKAAAYGLPNPKGVLITGVPGCGKSMTAKATAASWNLPLLRLDIGRIFSGLVGSSEQNLRTAIATAEAVAPCILWVDEIEKGFSNTTGTGDSGTSARVFGTFLTWLQEKERPVFVVATANNIDALPPEFLRKGRFDEIFFVDLPTAQERRVIWRIQLQMNATENNGLDALAADTGALDRLVAASRELLGCRDRAGRDRRALRRLQRGPRRHRGRPCRGRADDDPALGHAGRGSAGHPRLGGAARRAGDGDGGPRRRRGGPAGGIRSLTRAVDSARRTHGGLLGGVAWPSS